MPEIDNNQAANAGADKTNAGENGDAGAGQGTDEITVTDTTAGDGGKGKEGGENGQADTSKEGEADPNKPKPQVEAPVDDGAEPPVKPRMSKQDFIIGRQKAKLAKTAKADENKDGKNDADDTNNADDDVVAPEDEALINKVVSKTLAPIIEKSIAADDNEEVTSFVKANPDFAPFEAKVRRFMQHPSRRQLPVESIFYEVAGPALLKIGAERERAAVIKAKTSQTGGGSNRAGEGAKSDFDLSKDEFSAKQEKVRRGERP